MARRHNEMALVTDSKPGTCGPHLRRRWRFAQNRLPFLSDSDHHSWVIDKRSWSEVTLRKVPRAGFDPLEIPTIRRAVQLRASHGLPPSVLELHGDVPIETPRVRPASSHCWRLALGPVRKNRTPKRAKREVRQCTLA